MERDGKKHGNGSVVIATMATLRRNVKGERFLSAFEPARREAFVRRITDYAGESIVELELNTITVETYSDVSDLFLCDGMQESGVVPEFPIPAEEFVGVVGEAMDRSSEGRDFMPFWLAATCGVEDHFQLRYVVPGLDPEAAWERLDKLDTALNRRVDYAFRRDIGYLTANPALAGNALDFCAYVFPIGLELQNAAEETMRDMRHKGCVFEQSGAVPMSFSGLCKISYDCGGSRSEEQCAIGFRHAMEDLVERELDARADLSHDGELFLIDAFSRDLGILKSAYAISADEAVAKLWTVKVGLEMGYISGIKPHLVHKTIGGIRSAAIAMGFAKDKKEGWETLSDLFSTDAETRDDAEDYIDTIRADYLRWLFRNTKITE